MPKTAGSTTANAFKGHVHRLGHKVFEESRAQFISRGYAEEEWDGLFKFGFVRNPWDRYFSFFFHRVQHHRQQGRTKDDFTEFVGFSLTMPRRAMNPGTMFVNRHGHLALDFVGRFEHLVPDLEHIARRMDVEMRPLEHRNPGLKRPGKDWRPYYNEQTHNMVAEFGAWEIERFGYTFDDCG